MKFLFQGKVDILVLTKPKLENSFPTNQFMIDRYLKPFRLNRNRNGEGLLEILCKELKYHSFAEDLGGIFIKINSIKCKWLLFTAYHFPSQCGK